MRSVIEEQLPGVAAQGRAASCDVFCEQGVFTADQSRRILQAAAGYGLALRLHADELAPSGGAELAAELGALSADHLHTPSRRGRRRAGRGRGGGQPDGRDAAAGDDVVPHGGRGRAGPAVHRRRRARRARHGLQPRHLAHAEPAAGDDRRLPRDAAHARGGAGRPSRSTPPTPSASRDQAGSLEPGKQADLVVWRARSVGRAPYWVGADLVDVVVKGGRVVHRRGG